MKQSLCMITIVVASLHASACKMRGESRPSLHRLQFTGSASGGTLILGDLNRNTNTVEIATLPGESAASVAERLALAINERDPFGWWGPDIHTVSGTRMTANEGSIGPFPGAGGLLLAGTETGLGIPRPPLFLSGSCDEKTDQIRLRWENPSGGYDHISIALDPGTTVCPGTATTFNLTQAGISKTAREVRVIGYKNGLPSNAGVILVDRESQEELSGVPFTSGLAPNWDSWVWGTERHQVLFEQAETGRSRAEVAYRILPQLTTPADKPFRQLVKWNAASGAAGVYRRFLGLTPGETYLVTLAVGSRGERADSSQWAGSFWAATELPEAAGQPSPGWLAGRTSVAATKMYDLNQDRYAVVPSSHAQPDVTTRKISTTITLPADAGSILLWTRSEGSKPFTLSVDWVKLQRVTK